MWNLSVPPSPQWRLEFCPMTTPKHASNYLGTRLLGNFPVNQFAAVVDAPCWLGTLPSVLLGVRNRYIFSQQSPKMLKMASESFIHALLLFLGLFLKISRWVPLSVVRGAKRETRKWPRAWLKAPLSRARARLSLNLKKNRDCSHVDHVSEPPILSSSSFFEPEDEISSRSGVPFSMPDMCFI